MPIILLIILIISIILLIAGYFDLKTGEIPDRVSLGLISISLIISGVYSILKWDYQFFAYSALLGILYLILGYILFYLGQWGGGDVKLLSGIGCTLGFLGSISYFKEGIVPFYLFYFVNMGLIAFPYAIIYAFIFSLRDRRVFSEFGDYLRGRKSILLLILSFVPSFLAFLLKLKILGTVYLLLPLFILASFYLKAFERIALRESIPAEKLREGDVIAEDLILNGEIIASKRYIEGLAPNQIEKIRKLSSERRIPDRIPVKKGIKFAPILLIAFVFTVIAGNMMDIVFNLIYAL